MQAVEDTSYFSYTSPMATLEDLLFHYDWAFERISDNEISADAEGRWCNYRICALWHSDLDSLSMTCFIDLKIPQDKRSKVGALLSAFNPRVWLGHFEIFPEDDITAYRYTLTLRGNPCATVEQIEEIISSAVLECDRLYPALQFVLWGGKEPEEALMAAMLDTEGEA